MSVKEYIVHVGNTNRPIKSNGTVLTGDDITGTYLASSSIQEAIPLKQFKHVRFC